MSWTDPDPALRYEGPFVRPKNMAAAHAFDLEQKKVRKQTLVELSKTHGLFFFFRSDCEYCHMMAPTLKRLERESGMTVFPVSLDGVGIPDYPNPVPDRGFSTKIGINTVPALVLAVPSTQEAVIIGMGMMTEEEIYDRINTLTKIEPGTRY